MATKQEATRRLKILGFYISDGSKYPDVTLWTIGRNQIDGECGSRVVALCEYDTAFISAPEFWDMVIAEAESLSDSITPCPYPIGKCDYHDEAA